MTAATKPLYAERAATAPFSYLFVPGNRPERFDKALASGADAIVIDLEDAVSAEDKAMAREHIVTWLAEHDLASERLLVRINDAGTPWFDADLSLVRSSGIRGVMLPKVEHGHQVDRLRAALPSGGFVIPLIESARGVLAVESIAVVPAVQRLAFGTLDYAVDLELSGDERGLIYPACRIAIASRAAGLLSPVAGVTTDIGDEAKLLADLALERACGFGAKLCIHPRQVAALHRAMTPGPEEIAWAKRVLAAADAAAGAVQVDGQMVDRPVVLKAQGILDRAPRQ
jgi:citrate lyase subunit beta / citryl-CoA lyase